MALSEEEIREALINFCERYFKKVERVCGFEHTFLEENGFKNPEIDYTRLRRFIETAYNNLLALDSKFADDLLRKLFDDVQELSLFYNDFYQRTKPLGVVYTRDFLYNLGPYKNIEKNLDEAISKRDTYEQAYRALDEQIPIVIEQFPHETIRIKNLKNKQADYVHNYALMRDEVIRLSEEKSMMERILKDVFIKEFSRYRERYLHSLQNALNTKTYYLDKLIWDRAQKNSAIQLFFKKANIQGDYSIKTYLKYYLKTLDLEKGRNNEWHQYLSDVYKMME